MFSSGMNILVDAANGAVPEERCQSRQIGPALGNPCCKGVPEVIWNELDIYPLSAGLFDKAVMR